MERINVNDIELEYRWIGPPAEAGPTLVFLHEGLGCVRMWKDFPDRVAEATGWSALVYSRWGYGGSEARPLPWPIDHMEQEGERGLPALLDAVGVGDHVLWGHSDGASVALVNAGSAAGRGLKGVISVAAHVFGGEEIGMQSIHDARVRFRDGSLREGLARYHDDVDGAFLGWADTWLDQEFAHWTIERFLPTISVPLLVCQGTNDAYGTLEQVRRIADTVGSPAEQLILEGCGHHPHIERPEEMIEATAGFLGGIGEKGGDMGKSDE